MPDPRPDTRPPPRDDATRPEVTAPASDSKLAAPPMFDFLAPPELPGELGRLGPYRVIGVLGRGGMGAVFRAEGPDLKRQVALKVMLPQFAASPVAARRFVREAQAQAHVEHDHVIPIFQVGQDRG